MRDTQFTLQAHVYLLLACLSSCVCVCKQVIQNEQGWYPWWTYSISDGHRCDLWMRQRRIRLRHGATAIVWFLRCLILSWSHAIQLAALLHWQRMRCEDRLYAMTKRMRVNWGTNHVSANSLRLTTFIGWITIGCCGRSIKLQCRRCQPYLKLPGKELAGRQQRTNEARTTSLRPCFVHVGVLLCSCSTRIVSSLLSLSLLPLQWRSYVWGIVLCIVELLIDLVCHSRRYLSACCRVTLREVSVTFQANEPFRGRFLRFAFWTNLRRPRQKNKETKSLETTRQQQNYKTENLQN